jgi:TRAP-type mannitol/chloroaromatic compound transport system permease small subunit
MWYSFIYDLLKFESSSIFKSQSYLYYTILMCSIIFTLIEHKRVDVV